MYIIHVNNTLPLAHEISRHFWAAYGCVYVRVQARKKCSAKIALNYLFVQSISSFVVGKWLLREKCRDPGEFFGIILFGFENISTYTSNFSLHLSKVQLIKLRKQTHCASYMLTESTVKEFEYQL